MLDNISTIDKKDDDDFNDHDYSNSSNHTVPMNRVLIGYLVTYNILGVILHPNFYPWT